MRFRTHISNVSLFHSEFSMFVVKVDGVIEWWSGEVREGCGGKKKESRHGQGEWRRVCGQRRIVREVHA